MHRARRWPRKSRYSRSRPPSARPCRRSAAGRRRAARPPRGCRSRRPKAPRRGPSPPTRAARPPRSSGCPASRGSPLRLRRRWSSCFFHLLLGKALPFHHSIDFDQRLEQALHQAQRPGVRPVGERLLRIGMRLHEQPGDAARHRGTREHRDELALAARSGALPAGQLNRMGGVEHHRAAGVAHDGERAHVGNQVAVAEGEASLANENIFLFGSFSCFVDDVLHLFGREELALLDVDRPAGRSHGMDEIRLAAEESRGLQHVDHRGGRLHLCLGMHVGQYGNADLALHFRKYLQTGLHAQAAKRLARAAVRLVVRRLEDERNAERPADLLEAPGGVDLQLARLDDAGTRDEKKRLVQTDFETTEFHAATTDSVPPGRFALARCFSAAVTKALNKGWPARGVEVNSGWNCTPTKNGWPGISIISGSFSLGVRAETL